MNGSEEAPEPSDAELAQLADADSALSPEALLAAWRCAQAAPPLSPAVAAAVRDALAPQLRRRPFRAPHGTRDARGADGDQGADAV